MRLSAPLALLACAACLPGAVHAIENLRHLSIEDLGKVEVVTVSRRPETLNDAASAIHVITRDEIRRSGVTSIPQALRLAPGVEVAQNSAHSWTISIRGFSSNLSNKLLVLIDGRSVYSPLFAGVYWDAQNVMLEDIERIEVVAGPGGTAWGANAVNGVINIITRSAWETLGGRVTAGAGDELQLRANGRYGARLGADVAVRGYAERSEHDGSRQAAGGGAHDDWYRSQAGFRLDWAPNAFDALTVQGDVYDVDEHALVRSDFTLGTLPQENLRGTVEASGHNVLARWERVLQAGGDFRLQFFYDHTRRDIPGSFTERRDTFDVDFVHSLPLFGRHDPTWGFVVRASDDDIDNTRFATFEPSSFTAMRYSAFVQDKIALFANRLYLTLGLKLEHNDFSGLEYQPNVRLSWLLSERHTAWAAVSRAVRIPGRLEHDVELYAPLPVPGLPIPAYVNIRGSAAFDAEELIAYELGYRASLTRELSFDVALFVHDYDKLLTNEVQPATVVPGPPTYLVLPIVLDNGLRGQTFGGTVSAKWKPFEIWQLALHYGYTGFSLELRPGATERNALDVAGNSPRHQAGVHSYLQLHPRVNLYTGVRYVDRLPNQNVPAYTAVDLNLAWQVFNALQASVTVRNLDDARHAEFGTGNLIERSVFLKLDWRF